nr:PREDICTED: uncharacterized protein LOC102350666 [Latimeria chalumnae]|eukprot:XP_006009722.1 PREDICTED: uncharacterized protein LOC102350666 [Latimeria chalumnae]
MEQVVVRPQAGKAVSTNSAEPVKEAVMEDVNTGASTSGMSVKVNTEPGSEEEIISNMMVLGLPNSTRDVVWLGACKKLLVRGNVRHRRLSDRFCPRPQCRGPEETQEHLFVSGSFASSVWTLLLRYFGIGPSKLLRGVGLRTSTRTVTAASEKQRGDHSTGNHQVSSLDHEVLRFFGLRRSDCSGAAYLYYETDQKGCLGGQKEIETAHLGAEVGLDELVTRKFFFFLGN